MTAGLWFGGDYNPEQWPPGTWDEDDALMREARVNTATVGVFAWSSIEPAEGVFEFDWLDRTLDRLHANGVRVILATPTASPPPWFTLAHPDALPVTREGTRRWHGSRDTYCVAAPAYREAAKRVAAALAERYANHPAVVLWHVHNEYGSPCYCDHVAAAFRRWLRLRYDDDLAALNDAWYTTFWSQGYGDWEQILPPRDTQYLPNPAHAVDFARFWSDELLAAYREQRDLLRGRAPVTTNFMLPDNYQVLDFWRWSAEVDVVAIDHYLNATGIAGTTDVAFAADRARSFNRGRPWLLMEQAVGTIWPGHGEMVVAKEPGRMVRDSLAYVARGSDSVLAFQWRAGRGGSELHHSAMVPHAGADTRLFREVSELGKTLSGLGEIAGSTVRARAAILWDADSRWALELPVTPSRHLKYVPALRDLHAAVWRAGVTTDFARYEDDLSGYAVVFAPSLYQLSPAAAESLARYVAGGGQLVVGCFSGVVDDRHLAWLGGFPGGLRDVLGVRVEEFHPLAPGQPVTLTGGLTGRLWSEDLSSHGAEVLATYQDGPLEGKPAITRHTHGAGTGWYVSTIPDEPTADRLIRQVFDAAGVERELPGAPAQVEALRRHGTDGQSWLFLFNHGAAAAVVAVTGHELLTGSSVEGSLRLAPAGVAVIRETRPTEVN